MKNLRFGFLGLGLLLAVSAAQAQETRVKATIPFDFVVGNQVLPGGDYTILSEGAGNQAILVRTDDGKGVGLYLTNACSSFNPSSTTKLIFHKMAGRYFLSQVWMQGSSAGRELPRSSVETQLAKNHNPSEQFVLAANIVR